MLGVNHVIGVDVKVKRVVGLRRIVWVAAQRFRPRDALTGVLDQRFTLCQVKHREHTLAMHA